MALGNENVDFGNVISMIEKRVSLFQQEQADDDNKKTFCLTSVDGDGLRFRDSGSCGRVGTIADKIITVLTRYRPIVLELI